MFDTIQRENKYQCSEFGLYKYDSEDDSYLSKEKKSGFGFSYLVVLLTSIIVLSAICLVTYHYINENRIPLIKNIDLNEINSTFVTSFNTTVITEIIENVEDLETTTSNSVELEIPTAQELRKNERKLDVPHPFIYEIRDPKPTGFRVPKINPSNHQLNSGKARNIQEIIKILEQKENENNLMGYKKSKFKKDINLSQITDPFFPYKPQNPSDINLLATNGFRFAPSVQVNIRKPPPVLPSTESYPKYERPLPYYNSPLSLTLDAPNNPQFINTGSFNRKPFHYNNLYNEDNYFNQYNRFQQTRIQPNWNRPYWNNQVMNYDPQRNNQLQNILPNPSSMIVHLSLYPKKKNKQIENDSLTSESVVQNCTKENEDNYQIKNMSEFNHLLEDVHQSNNDKTNHLYRVKDTLLQLHEPDNEFNYVQDDVINDYDKKQNVEFQKSVGFTVLNPNFSQSNPESATHWQPIAIPSHLNENVNTKLKDEYYDLEIGEANDNYEESNYDTVTLPVPYDIFEKLFKRQSTPKYSDWDADLIQQNPNLINHKAKFQDRNK